jgi:hypothetical protein
MQIVIRLLQLVSVLVVLLLPGSALSGSKHQPLFFIERNKNANRLHYVLDLNGRGDPKQDGPVSAYWQMLAEDGHREELTWLERNFAYGWDIVGEVKARGFSLRLAAWDGRTISVEQQDKQRYLASVVIDGKRASLRRIYVEAVEGAAMPTVRSVTLYGTDLKNGNKVSERITP